MHALQAPEWLILSFQILGFAMGILAFLTLVTMGIFMTHMEYMERKGKADQLALYKARLKYEQDELEYRKEHGE